MWDAGGCMGVAAVKQAGQLLQSHMGDHGSFPINVQAPHAQHALSAQNGQQFAGGLQQVRYSQCAAAASMTARPKLSMHIGFQSGFKHTDSPGLLIIKC